MSKVSVNAIKRVFGAVVLPLVLVVPVAQAEYQPLDSVAAVVNNDVITKDQLQERYQRFTKRLPAEQQASVNRDELQRQLLDYMIVEQLQLQLAKEVGLDVSESEINSALASMAQQQGMTSSQFKQKIAGDGYRYDQFVAELKNDMTVKRLQQYKIGAKIKISEAELKRATEQLKKVQAQQTDYELSHILVATSEEPSPAEVSQAKKRASALMDRLAQGESFNTVAMTQSQGQHALAGGDLGWRKLNEVPSLFVEPVKKMKVGEVRGPIRSPNGFHILKLVDKRSGVEQAPKVAQAHVRHILIKTDRVTDARTAKKRIDSIRERIVQGEKFDELAQAYSDDSNTATRGGDLGWITNNELGIDLGKTIKSLPVNKISQAVQTPYGWHIIQVLGRRAQQNQAEQLAELANDQLYKRKFQEELQAWTMQLRDNAHIEIRT